MTMNSLLVFLPFVVCLPLFLLPSLCAFLNRKLLRWVLLGANLAIPPFAYLLFQLPLGFWFAIIGGVSCWLLVLHFSLRKDPLTMEDVDEDVELVPYDAEWPIQFTREHARIVATFGLAEDSLEHIGSTAVPGLASKPVIDMMLGVAALPPDQSLLLRLGILGYQNLGEAGVPDRWFLRLREAQAFNLHVVVRGGPHWANNLALRDLLRRDPVARDRYAQGKQAALDRSGKRLLAYSEAKHAVLAELLTSARAR